MIILSTTLFFVGTLFVLNTIQKVPESVSEYAYIMPHWLFSIWIILIGVLLMPSLMEKLPNNYQFIGFLMIVGIGIVAATSYYKVENKVMHYIGGSIAVLISQMIVLMIKPILSLLWLPLIGIIVWRKPKQWLYYIELLAFLLVLIVL